MTSDACIVDGYVDEPACLGVPPYLSPYIRYVAGVLDEHGYRVRYYTIDQLRDDPAILSAVNELRVVVMVAGMTVPGNYLGGNPANLTEIRQIGNVLVHPRTFLGGPVTFGYARGGGERAIRLADTGFDEVLSGEIASALDRALQGGPPEGALDYEHLDRWSVRGSPVVSQHPSFPHVMCEMETARGCSRVETGGCSFCTEPFYGRPRYRSLEGIWDEITALHHHGALHFRLGRQPDLLTYQGGGGEFPAPLPEVIEELFHGIRQAAPGLKTLHIDNINPGTIARHPDTARAALTAIVRHHTPGDVAAFGMETADPAVVRANNLKALPEEIMRAIEIVNEVGSGRREGIPELLPGLNFIAGLAGETKTTYDLNESFLREVLDRGLLVRRVNLRQLMLFAGTRAYDEHTLGEHTARFRRFKEFVRNHFDRPMLARVFPAGTILRDVVIEVAGTPSFGRQMGSYPILVGVPLRLGKGALIDAVVMDWGMRSVTALPAPVDINRLPISALKWIPGIGKKNAARIAAKRPFTSLQEFQNEVGSTPIDGAFSF
jgi:radical SAM superfamily enzyme with C-terminal helix-hairpin-helix motif